jgi:hypothetical protein
MAPVGALINRIMSVPEFNQLVAMSRNRPGVTNMGLLDTFLPTLIFRSNGSRMFQVSDRVERLLEQTDIGSDAPARYMRPPYPALYIEFGETRLSALRQHNPSTGAHVLEGVYLFAHDLPPHYKNLFTDSPMRDQALGLDVSRPILLLEATFTGSPVGKASVMDDSTQFIQIFIQDEDLPVADLVERHLAWYADRSAWPASAQTPSNDAMESYRQALTHLSKVLLYLHTRPPLESRLERTETLNKLAALGPKKRAKAERKLDRVYDRVIISAVSSQGAEAANGQDGRSVSTHWRRGHFRQQAFGAGRLERRLIWIKPMLIGGKDMGSVSIKNYEVR